MQSNLIERSAETGTLPNQPFPRTAGTGRALRQLRRFDRLDVARLSAGEWTFGKPLAAEAKEWPFLVVQAVSARASVFAGRAYELERGQIVLLSNSFALRITSDDSDILVVRLPSATVEPYIEQISASVELIIPTADGTASLVRELISGLASQTDDYRTGSPGRLAQHVVGLIGLMCSDGLRLGSTGRPGILQGAKDYIESHLSDVGLSADTIASAKNISTRTLQRLFENEQLTISAWIRSRRLEHCRIELGDTTFADISVSGIGSRWGLCDAAHFSRLFRATYGTSPRAYRRRMLDELVRDVGDRFDSFLDRQIA